MSRRESMLPLAVSAAAALLVHAALLPALGLYAWAGGSLRLLSKLDAPLPPESEPEPDEPTVGKEDAKVSSVAWIAYDDFRELMARRATTEQPALQQMEDPTPVAPPELDPTPPAPTAPPTPPAPSAVADAVAELRPLAPPTPPGQPLPFRLDDTGDARVAFAPTPLLTESPSPREAAPQPQEASSAPSAARPTASPRSDRESPPTTLQRFDWHQAGRVEVGPGIEVRTVAPRFSVMARYSAPLNPEAVIHFDRHGQALRVELVRSSGYENVDAPVLAALYKWQASGARIEGLAEGQTIEMPVRMVLRDSP